MFYPHHTLAALRAFILVACLAILAGCNVPTPPALSSVAAPTNVAAIAGDATVILTWTGSNGATSYNVKRAVINGGAYTQVAFSTSTTYTDTSVTNGTTYYYVVSAVDGEGEGANSVQVSATPQAATAPPAAPTIQSAIPSNSKVALTWIASANASGYRLKRATINGGPYTQIAAPTSNSYTDTSLTNGATYYYVVSAFNSAGESANSAQVAASPGIQNPPPTTFGTWTNVTPSSIDLVSPLCSNFGTMTVQSDPVVHSNLYTMFHCQGIWKSTDYGVTWTGPINTGTNGTSIRDCSGGITISRSSVASVPTVYASCIRGAGVGFWKSVDGGINWTQHIVGLAFLSDGVTPREDYYPPIIDPYDDQHLLMASHEFDTPTIVESTNGGQNWSRVTLDNGMLQVGFRSASILFVNTGNATTTRGTWLWISDFGSGQGTWRTTNGGAAWSKVDNNQYIGAAQLYQPDNNGVIYMAGADSALGAGVLRSTDYGQTWTHVGLSFQESIVFGTSKNVYSMFGFPFGPGISANPNLAVAAQPGTGTWVTPGTPVGMVQGPAQVAVVNDGTNNIFVGAMWNSGLWRYVEP
jgi:hypothetical protein